MYPDPYEKTLEVLKKTEANKSSMLQDIERGRKTEIDYINGAILRYGRSCGVSTPYNEMLYWSIKLKEKKVSAI